MTLYPSGHNSYNAHPSLILCNKITNMLYCIYVIIPIMFFVNRISNNYHIFVIIVMYATKIIIVPNAYLIE